jgi:uncharacterized protein (TIGR03083 family)
MQATTTYLDRVRPAIEEVGERFATLVSAAPDPSLRIRHSDWTVSEATAHVVTVAPRYADGPEGRGTWVQDPKALPELNQGQIRALGTHSLAELAAQLRHDLAALEDQVAGYGSAPPSFRFHGGELVPADVALGILLGELVVHGWDIAQAVHQPWPIDPGHVALILEGLVPIVPGWVDPQRARGLTPPSRSGCEARQRMSSGSRTGACRSTQLMSVRSTRTSPPTRPLSFWCSTGANPSGGTSPKAG